MNMAYYSLVFDQALDHVFDQIGIGAAYTRDASKSLFAAEVHVTYLREMSLDEPMEVTFQLLDWDAKRLHFFEAMYHAEERYPRRHVRAAFVARRHGDTAHGAVFRSDSSAASAMIGQAHQRLPRPEQVGSVIGIRR